MENKSFEEYKKLVAEITQGADDVKQLRASSSTPSQERILERMMVSYEEALSILNGKVATVGGGGGLSVISSSSDHPDPSSASLIQGLSSESKLPGHRKRKRQISRTEVVSEISAGDGYSWRKYGKKPILGCTIPRDYYKCSVTRGCQARKQVKRSDDDPMKWEITYHNQHTCTTQHVAPKSHHFDDHPPISEITYENQHILMSQDVDPTLALSEMEE